MCIRDSGMGRAARAAAMRGAFHIAPRQRTQLRGRHVLLVDDVMTSGATASACARTLMRAGAAMVDVLTYARVADDRPAAYAVPSTMRGRDGQG